MKVEALSSFGTELLKLGSMIKEAPAKSKKQQAFMAIELERLRAGKKTRTGMSEKQLLDYAGTPTKKLPTKVKAKKTAAAIPVENLLRVARGIARKEVGHLVDVGAHAAKEELEERGSKKKAASNDCPTCGEAYYTRCRCKLGDSQCKNGHQWHYSGGKVVVGPAPHDAAPVLKTAGPEMVPAPPTGDESPEMPPSPAPEPPPPPPEDKKHRAHAGIRAIYIWARRRRECPPGKALDEETGRCLPIKKSSLTKIVGG